MAKVSNSKKASSSNKAERGPSRKKGPPAYFLSLTVEDVRCFGSRQTLDLSDGNDRPAPWTVILGDNGVGKTTLLQCLAGMEPFTESLLMNTNSYLPSFASVEHPQSRFVRTLSMKRRPETDSDVRVDICYGSPLSQVETQPVSRVAMSVSFEEDAAGRRVCEVADVTLADICGLRCYGYGASRRIGNSALSESGDRNTYASLFSEDAALLNGEEWLLQIDYAAAKSGDSPSGRRAKEQLDQVKNVLIHLLPDVKAIRITEPSSELPNPRVEMLTPYGWVHLESLSLGYKTLIAWMVDLAAHLLERYPESEDPLSEPAVVLVDEIDLHLHPRWQRTIISYLSERFVNTQFIVTAHSPLIVQGAKDANIVLLRREGDHVVIDNDVKRIAGWRADQILTSGLFGLESARPPELDDLLARRQKLLSKSRLTKKDKEALASVESQIGELPMGDTIEDIEAMDIIRRAAKGLKGK